MIKELFRMLLPTPKADIRSRLDPDQVAEDEQLILSHRSLVRPVWSSAIKEFLNSVLATIPPSGSGPSVLEPGCGSGVLNKCSLDDVTLTQLEPVKRIGPPGSLPLTIEEHARECVKSGTTYDAVVFMNLYDKEDHDIASMLGAASQLTRPGGKVVLLFDAMPYFPGLNATAKQWARDVVDPVFYLFRGQDDSLRLLACPKSDSPVINTRFTDQYQGEFAQILEGISIVSKITSSHSTLDYLQEFRAIGQMSRAINSLLETPHDERAPTGSHFKDAIRHIDVYDLWAQRVATCTPSSLQFNDHSRINKRLPVGSEESVDSPKNAEESSPPSYIGFKNGVLIKDTEPPEELENTREVAFHALVMTKIDT